MNSVRVPIAALVGLVLLATAGFMSLSTDSDRWLSALYTLAFVALLAAAVAARSHRGDAGAFWFGFAAVGWIFWFIGLGNYYLFNTILIKSIHNILKPPTNLEEVGKYGNRLITANILFMLSLAFVAGLAIVVSKRLSEARARRPITSEKRTRFRWLSPRTVLIWATCTLAVLTLVGTISYLDQPQVTYFPDPVDEEEKDLDAGAVDTGTKLLRAMREPSLRALSQTDPTAIAYRFLWINWSGHPVAVRITKREENIRLNFFVLDGGARYAGPVAVQKTFRLSHAQWDELVLRVEKTGFWSMSASADEEPSRVSWGGLLVMEGVRSGQYHAVDRSGPDRSEFSALCGHMLDLSGFGYQSAWGGAGSGFR